MSASGEVTVTHEAPGESREHHLFDLPPDSWHYLTFQLPGVKVSSNPSVPLNSTLYEMTEKVNPASEHESVNEKWPYTSELNKR